MGHTPCQRLLPSHSQQLGYVFLVDISGKRTQQLMFVGKVKSLLAPFDKLGVNHGHLLFHLKQNGEIWYDRKGNFRALRDGPFVVG